LGGPDKQVLLVDFLDHGDNAIAKHYYDKLDRLQPGLLRRGFIIEHNKAKFQANNRTGTGYGAKVGKLPTTFPAVPNSNQAISVSLD
jgi:hypothetical protein